MSSPDELINFSPNKEGSFKYLFSVKDKTIYVETCLKLVKLLKEEIQLWAALPTLIESWVS